MCIWWSFFGQPFLKPYNNLVYFSQTMRCAIFGCKIMLLWYPWYPYLHTLSFLHFLLLEYLARCSKAAGDPPWWCHQIIEHTSAPLHRKFLSSFIDQLQHPSHITCFTFLLESFSCANAHLLFHHTLFCMITQLFFHVYPKTLLWAATYTYKLYVR